MASPVLCDGTSDDCTGEATTTRDTTSGYGPLSHFCGACATAYDVYIDNYDGPGDPDGEAFRGTEAADFARFTCDEAWKLK